MTDDFIMILGILLAVFFIFCVTAIARDSNRFVRVDYKVNAPKLRKKCRMVMLSDLHNKEYGTGSSRLVQAIDAIHPDMILIAGDMLTANEKETQYSVPTELIRQLAGNILFITGWAIMSIK